MDLGKVWFPTIQKTMIVRLTGKEAEELRAIAGLPEIEAPVEWWSNMGEKGQLIAAPTFTVLTSMESAIEPSALTRYRTGMCLTIRKEKPNRIVIQLPIDAYYLGIIPDVRSTVALYAEPNRMEFWKIEHWKEDAMKTATALALHSARTGGDAN